jgi:3-methyladenine DNA glycosylase/8-oxoguanine DNA glycosylase
VLASADAAALCAEVRLDGPLDVRTTFWPLRRGSGDPSVALDGDMLWRATRTPAGPATQAVAAEPASGSVRSWAWGPGAGWVLDRLAGLAGSGDDLAAFSALLAAGPGPRTPPGWSTVAALARTRPGLRIPRTAAVLEACVGSILEQKVAGTEARRSYRELLAANGEPAPGPGAARGLLVPPAAGTLASMPSWAWHAAGVERKRAGTLRRAAALAGRLEEAAGMGPEDGRRRLRAVPGIGAWTAAEVALVALGDADAVSVGDYHLPHTAAWLLAGRPRGDDALMLELLEPWRGQRGRVLRLLASAAAAPRFGPRRPLRSWRSW